MQKIKKTKFIMLKMKIDLLLILKNYFKILVVYCIIKLFIYFIKSILN
jgi:hypothetical protein